MRVTTMTFATILRRDPLEKEKAMRSLVRDRSVLPLIALAAAALIAAAAPARAAGNPDFDAVTWTALDCSTPDLVSHTSPSSVDFAGNATFAAAYAAHDATYLYFRY